MLSVRRNRWILLGIAAALAMVISAPTLAEQVSRDLNITEVYTATRPTTRGAPETRTTTFQRNSGWIFCYVNIENPSRGGNEIIVAFEPAEGTPQPGTRGNRLRVPARFQYRAVARTGSTMDAGSYRCVVRSRTGEVLSHADFQVTE